MKTIIIAVLASLLLTGCTVSWMDDEKSYEMVTEINGTDCSMVVHRREGSNNNPRVIKPTKKKSDTELVPSGQMSDITVHPKH